MVFLFSLHSHEAYLGIMNPSIKIPCNLVEKWESHDRITTRMLTKNYICVYKEWEFHYQGKWNAFTRVDEFTIKEGEMH